MDSIVSIESIISANSWLGTAEQREALRQFARDYDWVVPRIECCEWAADEVLARLREAVEEDGREVDEWAADILRAELEASAERHPHTIRVKADPALVAALRAAGHEASDAPDNVDRTTSWVYVTEVEP